MILEIKEGMMALIPQKEQMEGERHPYRVSGSLDMFGDITLTGNLTVQQSQWVYLRGPITSSEALINGGITASNLLIRKSRGNGSEELPHFGRAEIEGKLVVSGMNLYEKIRELERKIKELENEIRRR